jgi:hypothetical protein
LFASGVYANTHGQSSLYANAYTMGRDGGSSPEKSQQNKDLALALIAVIAVVVVALFTWYGGTACGTRCRGGQDQLITGGSNLAFGHPYSYALDTAGSADVDDNTAIHRMHSTNEVDPLVTGQLYAGPRAAGTGRRLIYGGRTSHGDKRGLHEFSAGVPGQAGVDVGLLGMREYSLDGSPDVFDDGIPENWQLPSTPTNWYVPQGRDYYDIEANGPGVYKTGLMSLQEPDHEPLLN